MNKVEHRLLEEEKLQQQFIDLINKAESEPPETLLNYGETKIIAVQDKNGIFHPNFLKDDQGVHPLFNVKGGHRHLRHRKHTEVECSDKTTRLQEVDAILNSVFPPITWREEGKILRRFVSSHPASRAELVRLQDRLDQLVIDKKVKPTGLCNERRKIFDQCLDELARQEIISCTPRGLLLLRIRDELRANLQVYESLYLSNAAYGVRKAIKVAWENENLAEELEQLKEQRQSLIQSIQNVREQLNIQEDKFKHAMIHSKNLFLEERDNLRRHNQKLKSQLESMIQGSRDN